MTGRRGRVKSRGTHARNGERIAPLARRSRTMDYPRTFVVNAKIVLRQAYVGVLVFRAPGTRQRRLLLVHHRIEQLQPVHRLALPRIRSLRLHNTPFIAGGGHHCHPLPHSLSLTLFLTSRLSVQSWMRMPFAHAARATHFAKRYAKTERKIDEHVPSAWYAPLFKWVRKCGLLLAVVWMRLNKPKNKLVESRAVS